MKFLCIACDEAMEFAERQLPGDGTMAAVFRCPRCEREVAMLTNPMETQFVSTLGVEIGGRTVPAQAMEQTRTSLDRPREDAFQEPTFEEPTFQGPAPGEPADREGAPPEATVAEGASAGRVTWDADAVARLERVPRFVRGMVKRIYTEYARERHIGTITVEVMDRARRELGLEGM